METAILKDYEKLNCDGRCYIDSALKAVMSNPAYLKETSEEDMQKIKRKQEEADKTKKLESEKSDQYFEELKAECNTMTKDDYISRFNEIFSKLPTYMLRYFFIIVKEAVHDYAKGGVCHE